MRLVWLIDPDRRTVLVLTPPDVEHLLTEEDTLDGGDALPGFNCRVQELLPPGRLAGRQCRQSGKPA